MNHRERQALDRHITGNYGEDSVSDTPETDAEGFQRASNDGLGVVQVVHASFARKLERQRDELLAALKSIEPYLVGGEGIVARAAIKKVESQ